VHKHLNLDDAWFDLPPGVTTLEARDWGPRLRFSAPPRLVESFHRACQSQLEPFVLYGSGDFHYLTALWLRRMTTPAVVVSFDNHPDWDVRPPKWAAGGWVNRALELPNIRRVTVWGCGNFECWWPRQIFGNRAAERAGRLEVHPWADGRSAHDCRRRGAILRENWREHFERFAQGLRGGNVYVTIDLDCLGPDEAVTNWESGRFTVADLVWALGKLRAAGKITAGDICGAYSPPEYARWKQKFAANFDHPKLHLPPGDEIRRINSQTIGTLWPALSSSL